MRSVVPWKRISRLIKPHYYNNKTGRPAYKLELMIKIYCLQQWYNLGDLPIEEVIYDRRFFADFLEIDLMNDPIPDESTILYFRHLLEKKDLPKQIFQLLNSYLKERSLIMRAGTIADATIIEAPISTKNQDKKRDPEMSLTKKNNTYYFGIKAHIGVDSKSGLVHIYEITTAKVADKQMLANLLHGKEKAYKKYEFGSKVAIVTTHKEGLCMSIEAMHKNP